MKTPRLSLVVLTWNEQANIAACLESIAQQTANGLEVIVVDAGSTDGTLAEIDRVREALPFPLRVHVGPTRMPIGEARNLGVAMAHSSAVAFLSADAELEPDWAARALTNLENVDMVFGKQLHAPSAWSLASAIRGLRYRFPDDVPNDPLEFASNVAAAYSKALLVEFPFDAWANAAEDLLLARRAAAIGYTAAYDPRLVVRHHDVATLRQEMHKNLREGRGCGFYVRELGVQWPVLAWLGLLLLAASVALVNVPVALLAIAAVLWLPALRRAFRRRHDMPLRSLVAGTLASPPFDLAFMAQYIRGLLAVRRTTGAPAGAPTGARTDPPTGFPTGTPPVAPIRAPIGALTGVSTDVPTEATPGAPTETQTAAPTVAQKVAPTETQPEASAGVSAGRHPLPLMTYTLNDTPAIKDRIGRDLAISIDAVRAADPSLRALVLTGGFARGEGTVLDGAPQNDYDFVAIRGSGKPTTSYRTVQKNLEAQLGMHIDLAPVPAWRLRLAEPSIFWYETALRGVTLWGEDLLPRIRTRQPAQLRRTEPLRLLVNRSAGLLLATGMKDPHAVRIQASKALLAAYDVRVLATGIYPPSHKERWEHPVHDLVAQEQGPATACWCAWAYAFKTDPANAPDRSPEDAWRAARRAVLAAVPVALRHAGLPSLAAYGRQDSLAGRIVYALRAHRVHGAKRLLLNPTGGIRLATLSMLRATPERHLHPEVAAGCLAPLCVSQSDPLETLMGLRGASLQ